MTTTNTTAPLAPAFAGAAACDILLSAEYAMADVAAGIYIGADGSKGSDPSVLPIFDLRKYREIQASIVVIGAAGSSPVITFYQVPWDQLTPHPGFGHNLPKGYAQVSGAGDGAALLLSGQVGTGVGGNTGVALVNDAPVTVTYKALFAQYLLALTSGSLSGLTSARVRIYGVR